MSHPAHPVPLAHTRLPSAAKPDGYIPPVNAPSVQERQRDYEERWGRSPGLHTPNLLIAKFAKCVQVSTTVTR